MASPYSGVYGAISKAIGESFGGLAEGAVGGEEIRQKRSAEQMQKDYLQQALQQSAMTNQYRQGLLGLRGQTNVLQQLKMLQDAQHQRAQEGRWGEESALGWTREARELQAGKERRAETERADRAREGDRADRTRIAGDQLKINQQRANAYGKHIDQLIRGGTSYTPAQRAALAALQTRLRNANHRLGVAAQFESLGQKPPGVPSMAEANAEMDEIARQIDQFAAGVAGAGGAPGADAAKPKRMIPPSDESVIKKYGLD